MTTHPNQGTGYARVANKLTNYLANIPGVEVVFYAFQNYPGQAIPDRFIDPRIRFYDALELDPESPKGFGDKGIVPALTIEKPDILFLYDDMMVARSLMNLIPVEHRPPKTYLYLDIVYPWQSVQVYDDLKALKFTHIFVFLECWRTHLVDDLAFPESDVSVLSHGLDFERLVHVPGAKEMNGFRPDDFLVLNMNRNSYRKSWETTIKAFLEFLKRENMNPRLKLYCGCMMDTGDGCNIRQVLVTECSRRGLDIPTVLNSHVFINPKPLHLSDGAVASLYSAADVGMNTCCGEGFGLTTAEHACFDRPQIVSGVPALKETLGPHAFTVEPKVWTTVTAHEAHGGDLAHFDYREFTDHLQTCFRDRPVIHSRDHMVKNYSWDRAFAVLDLIVCVNLVHPINE